jgi:hypothetical protein
LKIEPPQKLTMRWKEEGGVLHRWADLTPSPDEMADSMPDQYSIRSPQSVVNTLIAKFRYARVLHTPVRYAEAGAPIPIHASVTGDPAKAALKVYFRLAGSGFRLSSVAMAEKERNVYAAEIPGQKPGTTIWYFIQPTDDPAGSHGSAKEPHAILVSKAGAGKPEIRHTDVAQARAGANVCIRAAVTMSGQPAVIRLHYRHLDQSEDWRIEDMKPRGAASYEACIPGEFVSPEWDLMYAIEAVDNYGRGSFYPDLNGRQPFVVVPVK